MSEYSTSVQFIDLASQQAKIVPRLMQPLRGCSTMARSIMGPEVKQFENDLKAFTGANHALTCANGTDALTLVMMAWALAQGDAVFVPSFTHVASAETPAQLGATPFFVDVLTGSFNIDPNSFAQVIDEAKKQGLRPAVVIPVDLFGQPADIDSITDIASSEGSMARWRSEFWRSNRGRRVGTMGDATTTSFFPCQNPWVAMAMVGQCLQMMMHWPKS